MKLNLQELAVDTTEELNSTYFYAGRPNLTAGDLFFMVFCEEVAEQLGIDDIEAIVARDVADISFNSVRLHSTIACVEDKLW